jgi:TetR/AcrR family transcriptional repressor of lmrAB and yxaGH operons
MAEPPPNRQPPSSRTAFIEATADLMRRQGYGATAISEIVALSGAPKGSLYFHFPGGKEQLAAEAVSSAGERLRGQIAAILSSSDDLAVCIGRLIDALAAGLERSDYQRGCPIATVTLEAASASEAIRVSADAVFGSWLTVLAARMRADGLDPAAAERRATFVLSAVEGALILARARGQLEPLIAVRQELTAGPFGR